MFIHIKSSKVILIKIRNKGKNVKGDKYYSGKYYVTQKRCCVDSQNDERSEVTIPFMGFVGFNGVSRTNREDRNPFLQKRIWSWRSRIPSRKLRSLNAIDVTRLHEGFRHKKFMCLYSLKRHAIIRSEWQSKILMSSI